MYEFRQNLGHCSRHGLPECSVHFVSLSSEAEIVQNFLTPALSMVTPKLHQID